MFRPDDRLAPPDNAFDEPWQAQALALANAMIGAGHFSARQWSEELGKVLEQASRDNAPDTNDTYFRCVLDALESLSEEFAEISAGDRARRSDEWVSAYRRTPHGKPVEL